jgi:hypothetical protein
MMVAARATLDSMDRLIATNARSARERASTQRDAS